MCGRHDTLSDAIRSAISEEATPTKGFNCEPVPKRRITLWEQADNVHCSLLGTCASVDDIRKIARRVGMEIAPNTPDYDIHGHFVREATQDTAFSRAFQKLLDNRFEGAIRRVARNRDDASLATLWEDMCARGQVAAAYWAFMTQSHVPADLRVRIFGEVHMWSHLAGASYREKTGEVATLRDRISESEERSKRIEAGLRDALGARDREIAALKAEITVLRAQSLDVPQQSVETTRTLERRLDKAQRAVSTARGRARAAETHASLLAEELSTLKRERHGSYPHADNNASATPDTEIPSDAAAHPRTILYVGGLLAQRDRLRDIAARYNADFLHHDGGLEDAPQRLDKLLPSVDCVFCPVSCVSHDACLRAKKVCQKLNKPFVPLRSSGQSAFDRALRDLASAGDGGHMSGRAPQAGSQDGLCEETTCT